MEIKKNRKADLESKRGIFFQLGLILTLLAVFTAFEYKSYEQPGLDHDIYLFENTAEEIVPITLQKPKQLPPPPVVVIKTAVDEDETAEDIFFDAGADQETIVPDYNPDMPEELEVEDDKIYPLAQNQPEFPGGMAALKQYLKRNLKYPEMASKRYIQGRVYVSFVVEKDGSISNVRVLRGIGGGCDEEALRVVQNMPNWKAGMQMGRPVRVSFHMPIKFTLR